jgi:hypothetical protein
LRMFLNYEFYVTQEIEEDDIDPVYQ